MNLFASERCTALVLSMFRTLADDTCLVKREDFVSLISDVFGYDNISSASECSEDTVISAPCIPKRLNFLDFVKQLDELEYIDDLIDYVDSDRISSENIQLDNNTVERLAEFRAVRPEQVSDYRLLNERGLANIGEIYSMVTNILGPQPYTKQEFEGVLSESE